MKTICNSSFCTGCGACVNVCPRNAIIKKNSLFFNEMSIDEDKCVNCKRCFNVCPNNILADKRRPISVKQGWAANDHVRSLASSGGVETQIALYFQDNYGIVFCCSHKNQNYDFIKCESTDDILSASGSKYVKSSISAHIKDIIDILRSGKNVLLIALPCQIAAVLNAAKILNVDVDNLYTIDLICHGAPKQDLLCRFLKENNFIKTEFDNISFRKKAYFSLSVNGKFIKPKGVKDRYTAAFLSGLIYEENCYSCRYASFDRISDITLGDSWGSDLEQSELDKGISLILLQSKKGEELLRCAGVITKDVDINKAVKFNKQLSSPSNMPAERKDFIRNINKGEKFNTAMFKAYPIPTIKAKIKEIILIHKYQKEQKK